MALGYHGACLGYDNCISCCCRWHDEQGVWQACKLGLPRPLLHLMRAQPLYLLGCDTVGLQNLAVTLVHPHILLHNLLFPPYLLPYASKERWIERGKKEKKEKRGKYRDLGISLLLPPQAMAEQDCTPSTITQGHL
jgi:hypothetical protein